MEAKNITAMPAIGAGGIFFEGGKKGKCQRHVEQSSVMFFTKEVLLSAKNIVSKKKVRYSRRKEPKREKNRGEEKGAATSPVPGDVHVSQPLKNEDQEQIRFRQGRERRWRILVHRIHLPEPGGGNSEDRRGIPLPGGKKGSIGRDTYALQNTQSASRRGDASMKILVNQRKNFDRMAP